MTLEATGAIGFGASDSRGLWLAGADGVYLYDDTGLHYVAPLGPAPAPNYTIEGGCA